MLTGPVNAKHSKASVEWGTPFDIFTRARNVFGGVIELDPMSSVVFNRRVCAERIYTKEDDGLSKPWVAKTLFINPAGGLIREAWQKLCDSMETVDQAIWVGFSVEQLCLLADMDYHPLEHPTVICRKRISFERSDGYMGSPTHGNYITGVHVDSNKFRAHFEDLGYVISKY